MGGKSKSVITSYHYSVGLHFAIAHGANCYDILKLKAGDKLVDITADSGTISEPNLFGGQAKEGGIFGGYDVLKGGEGQGVNDYLAEKIGGIIPAFRNMLSFVWRGGRVSAGNPYIKNWGFLVKRTNKNLKGVTVPDFGILSEDGYYDANPAFIIREIITNNEIGLGLPESVIDEASYNYAFNLLRDEKFGISVYSGGYDTVKDLFAEIERVIDGSILINPRTGKFEIKLSRQDYDIATLPTVNEDNIINVANFKKSDISTLTNQLTLIYDDRLTGNDLSGTIQNDALLSASNGIINAEEVTMKSIKSTILAQKIAQRELKSRSLPLFTADLICNRSVSDFLINDVFLWSWPDYQIESVPVRVVGVQYGTQTKNEITLTIIQDVFGFENTVFTESESSRWNDPISEPQTVVNQLVSAVPYYTLATTVLGETDAPNMDSTLDFVSFQVAKPTSDSFNFYTYLSEDGVNYNFSNGGGFCPFGTLKTAITKTTTTLELENLIDFITVLERFNLEGEFYAYLGSELVGITGVNTSLNTVTVIRGILDTVPQNHAIGQKIFFAESFESFNVEKKYLTGVQVSAKQLPRTAKGTLDLMLASVSSVTLAQRQARPYNNAGINLNGVFYRTEFEEIATNAELSLSWKTRNRLLQTASFITQSENSITPEAGQTTTITIRRSNNTILRTVTGLTATNYTYLATDERADAGLTVGQELLKTLKVEIKTVKSGLDSFQIHNFTINRVTGS